MTISKYSLDLTTSNLGQIIFKVIGINQFNTEEISEAVTVSVIYNCKFVSLGRSNKPIQDWSVFPKEVVSLNSGADEKVPNFNLNATVNQFESLHLNITSRIEYNASRQCPLTNYRIERIETVKGAGKAANDLFEVEQPGVIKILKFN